MVQPSLTHTAAGQPGGAASGFGENNNWALTQASIFYAGQLLPMEGAGFANKLGVFLQATYDGVGKAWAWDNTELRFADTGTLAGHSTTYGFYANNNPTMQDPWNSTPAWGFPFTGSGLAPGPAAATFIDGGAAQQIGGAGAYAMFDNSLYFDVAGYHTLGTRFQKSVGVDPAGETQVARLAPYWRAALVKALGNSTWQVGTFGIAADTYPGRDRSAGKDRIVDVGFDSQYQTAIGANDFTVLLSWIHEHQTWTASEPLGLASNPSDTLWNAKATADYLYDKTYGFAVQYFAIDGSRDDLLYGDSLTGSPRSDGFVLQANYLPFNKGGGPAFWPKSNVKFSLQYTAYRHFNGAASDYDGSGRKARDNNTLYLEAWIVF
ncbi:MAG: cytochrome C [Verrucomicrobia bacterium]|nr:cytochrome C [Verrucomicrobiota bacterium]